MTGARMLVSLLFAVQLAGHETAGANLWDVSEEDTIPIPDGANWEFSDWNGDGLRDLLLIDGRTIRVRLQIDRERWVDDSLFVGDSYVAWDVLDSFTVDRASSLLLVGRDSLLLLAGESAVGSLPVSRTLRMPYGAATEELLRFPFAVQDGGWRAFAVTSSDSLLLVTANGRTSLPGGARTEIRGRKITATSPRVTPAHWDDDGLVDLILIAEDDLAVHRGVPGDGPGTSFTHHAEARISFHERSESNRDRDEIVRIAVCDLEGDGLADLVVTGEPRDPIDAYLSVAIHRNRGAGCGPIPDHFLTIDSWGRLLPVCDRDGDGLADLRIQTTGTGTGAILRALASGSVPVRARLYLQTASGGFERREKGDFSVHADWNDDRRGPVRFDDTRDWNRDGVRDMLIVTGPSFTLHQTTVRTGAGSFTMTETSRWQYADTQTLEYEVMDIDGDGVVDFARSRPSTGTSGRRELLVTYGRVRGQ
ncbi:MAG: hypothetical protein HKN20_10315 [Gemmatimonadetes bacterium]|nr:hypothetical protein [Gemmatimonadota bacterium]